MTKQSTIVDMTAAELRGIARKLTTYANIYTGDKEAREMSRRCLDVADLLEAATAAVQPKKYQFEVELGKEGLWYVTSPQIKGLLVAKPNLWQAVEGIVPAMTEMALAGWPDTPTRYEIGAAAAGEGEETEVGEMSDPLKPSVGLLAKLGSIAQHIDEGSGADGHAFDLVAVRSLLSDPEVSKWLDAMHKLALLPQGRGFYERNRGGQ